MKKPMHDGPSTPTGDAFGPPVGVNPNTLQTIIATERDRAT